MPLDALTKGLAGGVDAMPAPAEKSEGSEPDFDAEVVAAESMMQAAKSGDAEGFVMAFRDMLEACGVKSYGA